MNILIVGASRGIGLELVKQALEAGHRVTALVRDKGALDALACKQLKIRQGSIMNRKIVEGACTGQDAVCITVGIPPSSKQVDLFSKGTQHVLDGMKKAGVRRLLAVTGIGAGESRGVVGGLFYNKVTLPILLKHIYDDKNRQESLIRESGADWTIVRPSFLTRMPLTGKYRALTGLEGCKVDKISRADVAHFMLKELEQSAFIRRAPLLTY